MRWWVLWSLMLLTACGREGPAYQPSFGFRTDPTLREYVVGILPQHNMQKLVALYAPVVEEINARMPGVRLRMEVSRDFETFERKVANGYFDFAMLNPYQTVLSFKHGYRVFAKMADDEDFRGIILVRRDGGVKSIEDLKGKKIAYPSITALAAGMQPQFYLHTHGIDVNRDVINVYVGSQESSIMNVFSGQVAAAATWPPPWRQFVAEYPERARQLEIKWETEPLVNNGWVARHDIAPEVVAQFASALYALEHSESGAPLLAQLPISRFEPASNETYEPVRRFAQSFSRTVRPVEW
jgi:phosphonate transport system substrate-binding protein